MPAVGRPLKYSPEIAQQAREYIAGGYTKHDQVIPSAVGLARVLNVARSTLYKWAEEDDKELSDILSELKDNQHETLINKGLSGDFNSTITKLILTKHGYTDKTESKVDVNDYSSLEGDDLDRKIREMQQLLDKSKEE